LSLFLQLGKTKSDLYRAQHSKDLLFRCYLNKSQTFSLRETMEKIIIIFLNLHDLKIASIEIFIIMSYFKKKY
jgi:hypothetical protein